LETMDFLIGHIKKTQDKHKGNENLSTSLLTMWFVFNKYYKLTNKTPVYAAALMLNPCNQRAYLTTKWRAIEQTYFRTINRAINAIR
ncbi:hypothetical protein K469DRAFT_574307, partial [Zopfia rhizophila CBS 207.26]